MSSACSVCWKLAIDRAAKGFQPRVVSQHLGTIALAAIHLHRLGKKSQHKRDPGEDCALGLGLCAASEAERLTSVSYTRSERRHPQDGAEISPDSIPSLPLRQLEAPTPQQTFC
jgi:hypothetical protein